MRCSSLPAIGCWWEPSPRQGFLCLQPDRELHTLLLGLSIERGCFINEIIRPASPKSSKRFHSPTELSLSPLSKQRAAASNDSAAPGWRRTWLSRACRTLEYCPTMIPPLSRRLMLNVELIITSTAWVYRIYICAGYAFGTWLPRRLLQHCESNISPALKKMRMSVNGWRGPTQWESSYGKPT